MSEEAVLNSVVENVFKKLVSDHSTVVIATRKGGLIKTNRSTEIGQKFATWAAILCQGTLDNIGEEVRLMRVNTTDSEVTISTIPSSRFLLITIQNQSLVDAQEQKE